MIKPKRLLRGVVDQEGGIYTRFGRKLQISLKPRVVRFCQNHIDLAKPYAFVESSTRRRLWRDVRVHHKGRVLAYISYATHLLLLRESLKA